jgi:hypothetical protein
VCIHGTSSVRLLGVEGVPSEVRDTEVDDSLLHRQLLVLLSAKGNRPGVVRSKGGVALEAR